MSVPTWLCEIMVPSTQQVKKQVQREVMSPKLAVNGRASAAPRVHLEHPGTILSLTQSDIKVPADVCSFLKALRKVPFCCFFKPLAFTCVPGLVILPPLSKPLLTSCATCMHSTLWSVSPTRYPGLSPVSLSSP